MLSNRRVGKDCVALMWHAKTYTYITPLGIDDDRIFGIQIATQLFVFMFRVYFPCKIHSINVYRNYIDTFQVG